MPEIQDTHVVYQINNLNFLFDFFELTPANEYLICGKHVTYFSHTL